MVPQAIPRPTCHAALVPLRGALGDTETSHGIPICRPDRVDDEFLESDRTLPSPATRRLRRERSRAVAEELF